MAIRKYLWSLSVQKSTGGRPPENGSVRDISEWLDKESGKWVSIREMSEKTNITTQTLSALIEGHKERLSLSDNLQGEENLTYDDFYRSRPLEEFPETRKKKKKREKYFLVYKFNILRIFIILDVTSDDIFNCLSTIIKTKINLFYPFIQHSSPAFFYPKHQYLHFFSLVFNRLFYDLKSISKRINGKLTQ